MDFEWPENLYVEAMEMSALSFLIYVLAYLTDVARKEKGLQVKEGSDVTEDIFSLQDTLTPDELLALVQINIEKLQKHYPKKFKEGSRDLMEMERMIKKAEKSGLNRPLTLVSFDDQYQRREMVYGITKDDIDKRITVVFRGTENSLAFKTNWMTNANIRKVSPKLPEVLKGSISGIKVHSGFYNYIFSKTADKTDEENTRKYDVIMKDVKKLLEENPGYKLYVTGHSLGGALSSMFAFFASCEESLPSPVTCISFASPRIGDKNFQYASQWLEKNKRLRMLRVVNENDSVTTIPSCCYHHVGISLRLYEGKTESTLDYAGDSSFGSYISRLWRNSICVNLNIGYDHGDYQDRMEADKSTIEKLDLNKLYENYLKW